MSTPDDPKKPPARPATPGPAAAKPAPGKPAVGGAGRSASARSIGEELGGLDFEPDALLDSLLSDEPRKTVPAPAPEPAPDAAPVQAAVPGPKLFEPTDRLYPEEEQTVSKSIAELDEDRASADAVDDLLDAAPKEAAPAPPVPQPKPAPPRAPPPPPRPGVPRPGVPRPGVPRPAPPTAVSGAPLPSGTIEVPPKPIESVPPDALVDEVLGSTMPPPPASTSAQPAEPEAGAVDEELGDEEFAELPAAASDTDDEIDRLVGVLDDAETRVVDREAYAPQAVEPVAPVERQPWTDADAQEEHPASIHLAQQEQLDTWRARAEWMQAEAANAGDPSAKARALLVASELWAMVGEPSRARKVAAEAAALAPTLVAAQRQARLLAAGDLDWKAVAAALETEARTSASPEARAHALYYGAEVHRIALDDAPSAERKLEQLGKLVPGDARPYVMRLASELGNSAEPPKIEIPDQPSELAPLGTAAVVVARLRGDSATAAGPSGHPGVPFENARRALERGDRDAAAAAILELARLNGLELGALWLAAALYAPSASSRPEAIRLLAKLLQQTGSASARRALASRALEQGDPSAVVEALGASDDPSDGFSPSDRVALAALTGGGRAALQPWLEPLEVDPRLAPLAAAAASVANAADAPVELACGEERSRAELKLGRAFVAAQAEDADASLLPAAFEGYAIAHPGDPLAQVLDLELALASGAAMRVATSIAEWASADESAVQERDRHLAAGLLFELAASPDTAAREYAAALRADASAEPAVRALLGSMSPTPAANLLTSLADACQDDAHKSLLVLEAALRLGSDHEQFESLVDRAATLAPALPFAYRLGKQQARARGNADDLLAWLRRRREAVDDPVEQAFDAIREALVIADADGEAAAALLETASQARPEDVALHELHERLSPSASGARGQWREQVAARLEGANKTRLLIEAALEYERAGQPEAAAKAAAAAATADGEFARVTAERLAAFGPTAAAVADDLLQRAKAAEDPQTQRELYSRLAAFDRARGDASSARLWHGVILQTHPADLVSLRELEHAYLGAGRTEELEPIAAALASAVPGAEGLAHVMLATRLRAAEPASAFELVLKAVEQEPPSLWALRTASVLSREAGNDAVTLRVDRVLSERANRAIDSATLALRAAEAAVRLGRTDDAKQLLDRAVEMTPEHLVALQMQAQVLRDAGELSGAAEAQEALAAASAVDEHRFAAWAAAGELWLDQVHDEERGQHAFERASEIDSRDTNVFDRLRALYVKREERSKLAELLERRLELTEDPEERVALEVTRGRALAEVGDRDAAKQALAAALDANPDHADALDAFADLCVAEGDWDGAEQAWIRLARHAQDPERQAEIYRKLGRLYEEQLPNAQRAELSYKEILKRLPNDTGAMERLIQVYGSMGEPGKAMEIQNELLNRAGTPEEKRDRTIQVALVQEHIVKDRRKAEATLDKARKAWPQDGAVLRALAEFYRRGGETTALNVLLDRAANDARRALATGRFDAALFEALGTVAELRGGTDAARVANATLAALQGEEVTVAGAGLAAGDARLDELVAPELLSLPLRALLKKSGDALDAAFPVDLRTIRATPLPTESASFGQQIQQMATAFGVHGIEVLTSTAVGPVCMPVSAAPPRLVFGSSLLAADAEPQARQFLVLRSLKILQSHAATLSRTAPIDLWPILAAFLGVFAPNWHAPGVDAKKVAEYQQRIRAALVRRVDDDVPVLALEVIGSIGNRASQLGTAVNQWGNRTGLLALGDPTVALRAVALAAGHPEGPPTEKVERLKWIVRNPEARDLAVYSVSEQYTDARKRVGLGT